MQEKLYTISIDGESLLPKEIKANSGTASAKVQRFLDECNARFEKKVSFESLQEALNFMIGKFQKIVIEGQMPVAVSSDQEEDDSLMKNDYEEDK